MSDINAVIDSQVKGNDVFLYMKGTPDFPMCGFSGRMVQILDYLGVDYKSAIPMYDPQSDDGFLFGLTRELNRRGARNVKVEEMDLHINDPAFAAALAERINALVRNAPPQAEAVGG
jgi:hypothetical protein